MDLFSEVDPRLAAELKADAERRCGEPVQPLPLGVSVVLAGHRAAGKSRLLPHVAALVGATPVDLDALIAVRAGRTLHDFVASDEPAFRAAEREAFLSLPRGCVVAVGGGFLSAHAEVLRGSVVVLVPITFETYCDRLRADTSRPRLRPALSLDEELREIYFEREEKHRAARPLSLVDFVLRARRGLRPRRVVTLPPAVDPNAFAWAARHAGADLLEVRTDLTPLEMELRPAARALPLLLSQRGPQVPEEWLPLAELVDQPLGPGGQAGQGDGRTALRSFHADRPLDTRQALARWADVAPGGLVKHVEPLGSLHEAPRLFATQQALAERFGANRVTVLATGPLALPYRAVLAARNALDYLAFGGTWAAAEGQRQLADAAREWRARGAVGPLEPPAATSRGSAARLGVLGCGVAHSRSPRIHPQPFDRLDLPANTDLAALLEALHPHYQGFAVTSPFKLAAAKAVEAKRRAVNTLVRTAAGWKSWNTDVEGAAAVLEVLGGRRVTILGDGGVTDALREAARRAGVTLDVRRRGDSTGARLSGPVVWTWPAGVDAPAGLRFENATVAVIAYGPPAKRVAQRVLELGGQPLRLGARWFVAQARAQRKLWQKAV